MSVQVRGRLSLHRANNQKIVVLRPLKENFENDMIVITKDHHYQFKLKSGNSETKTHSFVYVHNGEVNKSYVKKLENEKIKILEGDSSILLINKSNKPILVMKFKLKEKVIFQRNSNYDKWREGIKLKILIILLFSFKFQQVHANLQTSGDLKIVKRSQLSKSLFNLLKKLWKANVQMKI